MEVPEQPLSAVTFEDLALPLFDQLYNFARWLTENTAEADDLVQETYVKALRGFTSFQQGTNFRAWMFRILRNSFLNTRSGLKATVPLSEEDEESMASADPTPEKFAGSAGRPAARSGGTPGTARALSRNPAALRSGGNVLRGNVANTRHPDRNCDVSFVARAESASRPAGDPV